MKRSLPFGILFTVLLFIEIALVQSAEFILKNDRARITVQDNGLVTGLFDAKSGRDYMKHNFDPRFCVLTMSDKTVTVPKSIETDGALWTVRFQNGSSAQIKCETLPDWFTFEVLDIQTPKGTDFYKMEFGRVFASPNYESENAFGFSPMILNIRTNILDYPGYSSRLAGVCYRSIGYQGAKYAAIAAPAKDLRAIMKKIADGLLKDAEKNPTRKKDLPVLSRAGGPFAEDQQKSHGSYIITSKSITADQTDAWTDHLKQFGVDQVDFHQGGAFSQADFVFNKSAYPNGIKDFRAMSDAFRAKGIICGLHTYAMFIPHKISAHVAPVPHQDLADIQKFSLAADLSADAADILVNENCDHVNTITGYLVWNSVYLRLDNEIVKFSAVGPQGSKKFIQCQRGVLGTQKSPHKKGTVVHHLGFYFNNYFVPESGSDLFYKIARDTAKTYDEGGFGMIYLDALDGNWRTVPDKELVWYYDALFVKEILMNIKTEAPLLEYSTMHASLWGGRSRMGAWDAPHKGFIAFFDKHFESNYLSASLRMLPGQIGWLSLCPPGSDLCANFQYQTIHREIIEYLGTKSLAYDYGFSYLDIPIKGIKDGALQNGKLLQPFDRLRRAGTVSDSVKKQLREPGRFFVLDKDQQSKDAFYPALYPDWKLNAKETTILLDNPFCSQNSSFRIENLTTLENYDSKNGSVLVPFDENKPARQEFIQTFDPPINLIKTPGLGMFVYGDGKGQILNVRVHSPDYRFSGVNDYYLPINFKGWKYVQWTEAENGFRPDIKWPNTARDNVYRLYRNPVYYDMIDRIEVLVHGDPTGLKFRSLNALPVEKAEMTDPIIDIGGQTIRLEGKIPAGSYAEYLPGQPVIVRDQFGKDLGSLKAVGSCGPILNGNNSVKIKFSSNASNLPSARITFKLRSDKPIQ